MASAHTPKQIESMDAKAIEAGVATFDAATLEALVRRTNREYWDDNAPTISDPLYDRLVESLRRLDPDNAVLDELGESGGDGPVIEANATATIPPADRLGAKVRHTRNMLSLDKCYGQEDLMSWADKFEGELLVMPKMDGVACSLRYTESGELFLAATRGSGSEGEDWTINALEIDDIPKQLDKNALPGKSLAIEVRGEVFMRLSVFKQFAEQYSNPRNLTAGGIKHKDRGKTAAYQLSFYAYSLFADALEGIDHERDKFGLLERLGFRVEECEFVARDDLQGAFERWSTRRATIDYEIDGVVYRAADIGEQDRVGETGHHPRWSIAYKFQGDTGTTTINEVVWSVSRTGTVTPVAMLEPIELSGAMIGRAGLHNLNRFEELGLSVGATVEVTRRGGVIPHVERVIKAGPGAKAFEIPKHCPACASPTERRKKRDGEFLFCSKPDQCVSARLGELQHFAKVVDIQGFGPKVVTQAVDAGLMSTVIDFYTLTVDDLEGLDRLGRKSAQNLVAQVDAHKTIELPVFLQALGIDHLGRQNGQLLADEFRSLAAIRAVTRDALLEVKGIKDAIADAIMNGLESRTELIDGLLKHVTVVDLAARSDDDDGDDDGEPGVLGGKSFLFTGALEAFTRKVAQQQVEDNGGVVAAGVNKALDYLVIGAGKGAKSSKQKKAEKLVDGGAPLKIITEGEFLTMVADD